MLQHTPVGLWVTQDCNMHKKLALHIEYSGNGLVLTTVTKPEQWAREETQQTWVTCICNGLQTTTVTYKTFW